MRVVFFNYLHNGDLHVSRGFIIKIIEKVLVIDPSTTFTYTHLNDPCVLSDISNLGFDSSLLVNVLDSDNLKKIDDDVYINTWYAQQSGKYIIEYGTNLDSIYAALDDTCKQLWNFSLENISTDVSVFFPIIDYSKYEIAKATLWLENHKEKKIFVANCQAMSGQADNFNMTEVILKLAEKHSDKYFILSNREGNPRLPDNVCYSENIIQKKSGSDLNENSFISSHCDMIIGRSSGPSTFAITQETLFKKPTIIIYFSKMIFEEPNKFWVDKLLRDKVNYAADILCVDKYDTNYVFDTIDGKLSNKTTD